MRKPETGSYILVDDLNIVFIVLNTFVGFTTSAFSASYIGHEVETGRLSPIHFRFYHAMYQVLLFSMNLALIANNIGFMWVAVEMATLTTVLMVGVYRTPAVEAAWKYFILGSVGIAFALLARSSSIWPPGRLSAKGWTGWSGRCWSRRSPPSTRRCSTWPSSFLCLATAQRSASRLCTPGCLTPMLKVRRRSRRFSPACCSMLRSTPCCGSSFCWRRIAGALAPGPLMATLGLGSLIFAGLMLYRRKDVKRLFGYSSIEHMGIIAFAFGMGGGLANFAGLLHMTMHSLTKSAIFFAVGHSDAGQGLAAHRGHSRLDDDPSSAGLGPRRRRHRNRRHAAAWRFSRASSSLSARLSRANAILALLLVAGLIIALGALMLRLQGMAFGEPTPDVAPSHASYVPMSRISRWC